MNHHDHREVGWATVDACAPAAASPLYFPEAGAAHGVAELLLSGTLEPDVWVDITGTVDDKAAALRCHRSQVEGREELLEDWVRQRAAAEGAKVGVALRRVLPAHPADRRLSRPRGRARRAVTRRPRGRR